MKSTLRSVKRRVVRLLNRSLPGPMNRIRSGRRLQCLVSRINPVRLLSRGSEAHAVAHFDHGLDGISTANVARALCRNGQQGEALLMLDEVVARHPKSSVAWFTRAQVKLLVNDEDILLDLISVLVGDRLNVELEEVISVAYENLMADDFLGVSRVLAATVADSAGSSDFASAERTLRLLLARAGKKTSEVNVSTIPLSTRALGIAIGWAEEDLTTRVLDDIFSAVNRTGKFEGVPDGCLMSFARAYRARGDLTRSLLIARRAQELGVQKTAGFVELVQQDLELFHNGWKPRAAIASRKGKPGSGAYLVTNSLPFNSSGYSTRSQGVLRGLAETGWDLTAYTPPGYPRNNADGKHLADSDVPAVAEHDGVKYARLASDPHHPAIQRGVETFAKALLKEPTSAEWGVIHAASNFTMGLAAVEAGRQLGIPVVYEVRGLWEITRESREPSFAKSERFQMIARLETEVVQAADHTFAITGAVRDILVERGAPSDRISILPNGVDTRSFVPLVPHADLREKLGLRDKVVIGYVGSLNHYEGLELLIEATAQLAREGAPVVALIVGSGAASESIREVSRRHGIEDRVIMPGRVAHSKVQQYYSVIDIAPFPRLPLPVTEAVSPLKPFEAMAMAKPVVVSSVGALSEFIVEDLNGRVFAKGDATDLARTLRELVEDRGLRESLGKSARQWVGEKRSWAAISRGIDSTYRALGVLPPEK